MIKLRSFLLAPLCGLFLTCNAWAYHIEATVTDNRLYFGDTLTLTVSADEYVSDNPDFSVLDKDFKILSNNTVTSTQIINGTRSDQTKWRVTLLPLKEGKINIPSVRVGREQSAPITITVLPQNTARPGANEEETSVAQSPYTIQTKTADTANGIYVQQQIRYDVIVTDNGTLQSGEPNFEFQNPDDWLYKSLGKPVLKTKNTNGRLQRILTYSYAFFPQKSGSLTLPAVIFEGEALSDQSKSAFNPFGNGLFGMGIQTFFQTTEPVRLIAPSQTINILPVPTDFKGSWWLPAEDVEIRAEWVDQNPVFRVGEALTREITIRATGLTETQLPDTQVLTPLFFAPIPQMKQYPQKSVGEESIVNGNYESARKIKNVYIPQETGAITLPEGRLSWFNVRSGKLETATFPAVTINIEPSVYQTTKQQNTSKPNLEAQNKTIAQPLADTPKRPMLLGILSLSALLIIAIVYAFYQSHQKNKVAGERTISLKRLSTQIENAARQRDFKALQTMLIILANRDFPNIRNLHDLAIATGNSEFAEELSLITAFLYRAEQPTDWNAERFIKAFRRLDGKLKPQNNGQTPLPPLYD